jgi:hypothetical protein
MSSKEDQVETGLPVTQTSEEKASEMEEKPRLNMKNWLNLAFYIFNCVFTFGVGNFGWFGNGDNGEISREYQTIVTPKSTAFTIWSIIFVFQAIFVILQLLPRFRAKPMVQQGVGYWYVWVCTFQVAWTFAFSFEVIWLSLVFILSIWISLCALVYSQYYTESDNTLVEFWFFRFSFAMHCGWLTAASAVNVNLVVVNAQATAAVQLAVGIISLAVLHAVSVWVLFGLKRNPNYTIAGVLAWANGWIYAELSDPSDSIIALFSQDTVSGVSYAAAAVAYIITGQIVVRFGIYVVEKYASKNIETVEEQQKSEEGTDEELAAEKV